MTTSDASTAHEQNLTRQRLAAVRDELIETANILDTVLDGSITQAAAAQKLGITPQTLSKYLAGGIGPYVRKNILKECDLTERVRRLRSPDERLLVMVFRIDDTVGSDLVLFPPYDPETVWDTAFASLTAREYRTLAVLTGLADTENQSPGQERDVADELCVSIARVGQIKEQALRKLRGHAVLKAMFPAMTVTQYAFIDLMRKNADEAEAAYRDARSRYDIRLDLLAAAKDYDDGVDPEQNLNATDPRGAETPIESLPFGTRAGNILMRNGIKTLEQLAAVPEEQVIAMRGMGPTTAREIYNILKLKLNLDLPMLKRYTKPRL